MGEDSDGHLIVIGASAGGIEALSILVATLPQDLAAPVLVAQHLDPRRESHLGDILARRTPLPVVTVEDQAELRNGTIYLVPANRDVSVTDHEVRLSTTSPGGGPSPSVDLMLSTAAETFGERLIAVILTGTGSDGADGARHVKAAGGTVIIQDPETARFPAMPSALSPTNVDIITSIEAMGTVLRDLAATPGGLHRPDEERLLSTFLGQLRERTGIDFAAYKQPTILRRLQRRMAATQKDNLRAYVRYAAGHPEEYQRLASSFLIKVTEFFRDVDLFDHLRKVVVPQLIEDAKDRRELRIWSAGCATGEEAYSLAIIVADALGDRLPDWNVRVFATDLDSEAIAYARRAVYPAASLAEVEDDVLTRFFERTDAHYEVRKSIRALTVFGQHDLALRAPFPRIDLALCRNVLIYFTPELQRRALQLFAFSLRDGGWLALGKAETTSPLAEYFVLEEPRIRVYRRRGQRLLLPPAGSREALSGIATEARNLRQPASRLLASVGGPDRTRPPFGVEHVETGLNNLPVGIVAIDRGYDITAINATARRLLSIHGPAVGSDVIHAADRLPAAQLRVGLDEALAGRSSIVRVAIESPGEREEETPWLELECHPAVGDAADGEPSGALIVVRDVTPDQRRERELVAAVDGERRAVVGLTSRIAAFQEANERLLRENEEMAAANADLRGANEELLVANEEVQAATEEVETLNEELQATNEELETLNEELQATVEELNTTNDDLAARSADLQETAASLDIQRREAEHERARLANLVETLQDAVVVVDGSGERVIQNSAFASLRDQDGARTESDGHFEIADLEARVAGGEAFALSFSITDGEGHRRWFEAYGHPAPAEMGLRGGGILVVHDTTELSLRRLQEEFVAIVAHELRTPLTALRGYLQLLVRRAGPEDDVPRHAVQQVDRLQRMIDELFDATRAARGRLRIHPEPVSLATLVTETVRIGQGLSDRHDIRLQVDRDDVTAEVDPGRIQQVLLNLLLNAIVHAPDSSTVDVRLRHLRRRAEIEVEDHGPGIPLEQQAGIFNRFHGQTTSPTAGLGLGLFIARELVAGHGGTIDVDSEPGEGTTFTVRLPLTGAQAGDVRLEVTLDGGDDDGAGPPRAAASTASRRRRKRQPAG